MPSQLLSRHADALYWLARQLERAENVARMLDVNETFSRDSQGVQNWRSVLDLYADDDRYDALGRPGTAEDIVHFYTLDPDNGSSILSLVRAARENARMLRPLMSTEMWVQLNTFYNALLARRGTRIASDGLPAFCRWVKEAVQLHSGITDGTLHRDEGWLIYTIGRHLERADQATRIVDVKYHLLLPSLSHVGSVLDVSQWNTLLRSIAAYHAFRRVNPRGMSPAAVAGFLLFDPRFPRSVRAAVEQIDDALDTLERHYEVELTPRTKDQLDELRAVLGRESVDSVILSGLHEFLDRIQLELMALSDELCASFHGGADPMVE